MKPFDLEQAKAGKPVIDLEEEGAIGTYRFSYAHKDGYDLHVFLMEKGREKYVHFYNKYHFHTLCMAPEIKTVWVNLYNSVVYKSGVVLGEVFDCIIDARREADKNKGTHLKTIEIEL